MNSKPFLLRHQVDSDRNILIKYFFIITSSRVARATAMDNRKREALIVGRCLAPWFRFFLYGQLAQGDDSSVVLAIVQIVRVEERRIRRVTMNQNFFSV